jgi:hypothetical protein
MKRVQRWQPRPGALQDQTTELTEAWRAVATAKLTEFRRQCWRLADLVRKGTADKAMAADQLWEIAVANALVLAHGEDRIEAILAEAFAAIEFHPLYAGEAVE